MNFIGFLPFFVVLVTSACANVYMVFYSAGVGNTRSLTADSNFRDVNGTKFFDAARPTAFYVHGWRSGLLPISTKTVVSAYLSRGDHNVIAVDWSEHSANINYVKVAGLVDDIAAVVAHMLKKLQAANVDVSKFHFIGHSLGAQMLGEVGKQMLAQTGFRLKRITGLDPAGPLFGSNTVKFLGISFRVKEHPTLSAGCAEFVDIIHTDAGSFGSSLSTGHIDFWPNGGNDQPGCAYFLCLVLRMDDCLSCDHGRAWKYYAESVLAKKADIFGAMRCQQGTGEFTKSKCMQNLRASMGFYAKPTNARGNYFVETNWLPPYSK